MNGHIKSCSDRQRFVFVAVESKHNHFEYYAAI